MTQIEVECPCGGRYEIGDGDASFEASCPKCGARTPFPELELNQVLLQITPQIWKVLCGCGQRLKLPRKMGGHRFLCPKCKKLGRIPRESAAGSRDMSNDVTLIISGESQRPTPGAVTPGRGIPVRSPDAGASRRFSMGPSRRAEGPDDAIIAPPAIPLDLPGGDYGEARGGLGPLAPDAGSVPVLELADPDAGAAGQAPADQTSEDPPVLEALDSETGGIADLSLPKIILPPTFSFQQSPAMERGLVSRASASQPFEPIPLGPASPEAGFSLNGPWEGSPAPAQATAGSPAGGPSQAPLLTPPLPGAADEQAGPAVNDVDVSAIKAPPLDPAWAQAPLSVPGVQLAFDAAGTALQTAAPGWTPAAPPAQVSQAPLAPSRQSGFWVTPPGVCPGCRASLPQSAVFCVKCGFDLRSKMKAQAATAAGDGGSTGRMRTEILRTYFNVTDGVEAAKTGLAHVGGAVWLYLPVALISAIIWELSLLFLLKGGFAGNVLVATIQPLIGSMLLAGLTASVRDSLFQTEFCIKRLLYNSARYWPNMFLGLVLNVPFWTLAVTAGVAISILAQSKELGLALKIGLGIPLGLGGVIWVGLMGLLLPVATILEEGSPIRIFEHVLKFGLNNAHKLFGLAVAVALIGGGIVLAAGFLYVNLGSMAAASMPPGLFEVTAKIVAAMLGASIAGEVIASLSLLYISHIEDPRRLVAMREQIGGPVADSRGTKIAVVGLLVATVALGFLLPAAGRPRSPATPASVSAPGEAAADAAGARQPEAPSSEPVAAPPPSPQGSGASGAGTGASGSQGGSGAPDEAPKAATGAN